MATMQLKDIWVPQNSTRYATLDEKLRLNYDDDWWHKRFMPFGYDGGGNAFGFSKDIEEICYMYEDDSDDDGNVPIVYLASDFLEFLNNMVESMTNEKTLGFIVKR